MAEGRRIPFETVKPSAKEKKTDEEKRTIRLALDLKESNEKSCPEFSYVDLIRTSLTTEKKKSEPSDPYNEEDDEDQIRQMARKFEEKYGPKPGKAKKRVSHFEDYIDRGMGYDESDPFIDNDEAYDELVPSTLTTQFGGFYINSGELEFRAVSDADSNDSLRQKKKRRKYKEILAEKEVKRRKRLLHEASGDTPSVPKKRGRKPLDRTGSVASSADESALNKARRKAQPTVAVLLQERKAQMQQLQNQTQQSKTGETPPSLPPPIALPNLQSANSVNHVNEITLDSGNEDDSPLPVPVIASSSEDDGESNNVNDIIESVVKNAEPGVVNGDMFLSGSCEDDSEEFKGNIALRDVDAPKLPDNLPADLEEMLRRIKQAALVSAQGKCKFFSEGVNNLLLSIEVKSRELACAQRSMVYSHLASYLPCTKDTLLKRAKKLRLDQEGGKLADPMQKLRKAVNEAMPAMIEKYNNACNNAKESKLKDGLENDENHSNNQIRKKFDWTEHLRLLLCEVVSIKLKCYEVLKTRTQSAEEYLQQFLEYEVKALWPQNWMNTKILLKQSRSAHAYLSNRPKKPWLVVKKPMLGYDGLNMPENLSPAQIPEDYEEIPRKKDEDDDSASSLKLVIASPPHMPQLDPVDKEIPVKGTLAEVAKIKADIYADVISPDKTEALAKIATTISSTISPNKRIFTLMNSEEAAQLQQNSSKQSSYADEMLNRIICASLANFPNSGSSMALPEIGGKPIKTDLNFSNIESPVVVPGTKPAAAVEPPKTSTPVVSTPPSPHAISILKANYSSSPQSQNRTNRVSVLEHGSNLSPQSVVKSVKSNAALPSMPFQAYEFQEAFKRSLSQSAKELLVETPVASMGRSKYLLKRQQAEKSEEPMNFSTASSSGSSYMTTPDISRIPVSNAPALPLRESPKASRAHRSSPDVVPFPPGNLFPEGMKGFPMPLKSSNSVINASVASSLPPPPAHGFPSRRTSPSEKIFTSPHRSSVTQSHHPSSSSPTTQHHHSPSGGSSHRSSYKTPNSLPQFIDPALARSLVAGPWRTNRARASPPSVSSPSQFHSGSVSVMPATSQNYSITPSSLTSTASNYSMSNSPKLISSQRGSSSKAANIPTPAHQSVGNAQTPVSRSQVYSSMYGSASFSNSQLIEKRIYLSGPNPQSAHQRIP